MEALDLDFGIPMTAAQWAELGRTANALAARDGSYAWDEEDFDEIRVLMRDVDAPDLWRNYVSSPSVYGARAREAAQFHFNGGRPYARMGVIEGPDEPVFTDDEEETMRRELERWVRDKWHALLRDSGLHYERGHIPQG
ncbi:MAG TPA: hypothetical protein VF188_10550 [Longimicrobiales bacterium]